MSEIGFENVFYLENFDCSGDEVLVESTPPASPDMAAQLAGPAQGASNGGASPSNVHSELIVIPELPNSIHLQHAIQQVSTSVVEVNGDSSGQSSPSAETQHTYIVATGRRAGRIVKLEIERDQESGEGGNGVNYHVQYVEPQEMYTQSGHDMDTLRSYPVYNVANVGTVSEAGAVGTVGAVDTVGTVSAVSGTAGDGEQWAGEFSFATSSEQPMSPAPAARMPPATVQWLLDHYETAEGVSLPRSSLYAHYLRHCTAHRLEPVNAASFGKLIRSVFVGLRTRRLGTRGNSKYHYYGIRAKPSLLRDLPPAPVKPEAEDQQVEAREREPDQNPVSCSGNAYRQYLGSVAAPVPRDLVLDDLPDDIPHSALDLLRTHHRDHGVEFLQAVAALDTAAVERARRNFWKRPPPELCRRVMCKLTARKDVAAWLRLVDLDLYQCAVELLLPEVLRPIPPQLTQSIRNFAKSLECVLAAGGAGAPALAVRAQASAASALSAALRRYTSLNHLAQAARAVLNNHLQIQQMVSDLNRVDFRVVREQATWACATGSAATAHRIEADFKSSFQTTLGRGTGLEQWASWLDGCVRAAMAPHEHSAGYVARARRLLLDWSFYSSLVIRELTLRSAASFGSFHLIRLLYDEYVSFQIERRVAAHTDRPPIAVMRRDMDEEEAVQEEPPRDAEEEGQEGQEGEIEWEWADDDEDDDDDVPDCKRSKMEE